MDYFYEVYLCITNVESYCILLRSKLYLFNEEIKLPSPSLTFNKLIMSCWCEVILFTVGIFKADTKGVVFFPQHQRRKVQKHKCCRWKLTFPGAGASSALESIKNKFYLVLKHKQERKMHKDIDSFSYSETIC